MNLLRGVSASNRMLRGSIRVLWCLRTQKWPLAVLIFLLALGTVTIGGRYRGYSRYKSSTQKAGRIVTPSSAPQSPLVSLDSARTISLARGERDQPYAKLPMSFEANQGQAPSEVQFISRGSEYGLFLTADGAVLGLRHPARRFPQVSSENRQLLSEFPALRSVDQSGQENYGESLHTNEQSPAMLRLKLIGANATARPTGLDPLLGKSNHFIGRDPAKWHAGASNYARVSYPEIYPGVELVYYGNQRHLEYDFILAPGAAPGQIEWQVQGDSKLVPTTTIDPQGNLLVSIGGGTVHFKKPFAYEIDPKRGGRAERRRVILEASYVPKGNNQFGFAVPGHDPTKTLIIDPVVEYSTYLGGSADDGGWRIALDSNGDAYVTGQTLSINFPMQSAAQTSCASCAAANPAPDVFVTKFNSTGSSLIYSTYLGGSLTDAGFGIAVDPVGNALVTGITFSTDFPVTAGAFQSSCMSCTLSTPLADAFVVKLDTTGKVVYSTYLGGSKSDEGLAIAADSNGNAYVTGLTNSSSYFNLNSLPAPNNELQGTQNAFVARFSPTGTLLSSTYLGGSDIDSGNGIAVDTSGIYVVGQTSSNNFPIVNSYQGTFSGVNDAFVSKLKPDGSGLIYSTYFGGPADDIGTAVAIDSLGNAYITGSTTSTRNFPVTPGAFQTVYGGGGSDAFVAKLSATGSLVYSTYLGGSDVDAANGIAVVNTSGAADPFGTVNVVGQTASTDFPTANPVQPGYEGNTDAFVTRLVPTGCAPTFSTYLAGHSSDFGTGIAVDSLGNAYVTGRTSSNDFMAPLVSPLQGTTGGSFDAFLTRLNSFAAPALCMNPNTLTFPGQALTTTSAAQTVTITNGGIVSLNITGVTASGSFGQTNTCLTSPIAAGANCTVDVTFAPTGVARNTGTVSITDNAGGSPQSIALLGAGTDFSLSASPPNVTVTAGQPTTFTLTVGPLSGFNSTVALTCSGFPLNSSCTFSPSSITLDGSSAATSTVTISTKARSGSVQRWGPGIVDPGLGARGLLPLLLVLAIFFVWARVRRRPNDLTVGNYVRLAGLVGLLLTAMLCSSCGFQSNTPSGTPAGNFPLTLTGTDGTLQRSVRVTLTIN
jgi:hypothetical protein